MDIVHQKLTEFARFRESAHPTSIHNLIPEVAHVDVLRFRALGIEGIIPDVLVPLRVGCADFVQKPGYEFVVHHIEPEDAQNATGYSRYSNLDCYGAIENGLLLNLI